MRSSPVEGEIAIVDEIEDLVLLVSPVLGAELQGMASFDPGHTVAVLPGVVAARLRTLIGVADGDVSDRKERRAGGAGIVRNNAGEAQAGRRVVILRLHAGLVAAMERRDCLIDHSGAEGVSIVQSDVVVGDEVQFSETRKSRAR